MGGGIIIEDFSDENTCRHYYEKDDGCFIYFMGSIGSWCLHDRDGVFRYRAEDLVPTFKNGRQVPATPSQTACPACAGAGRIPDAGDPCASCGWNSRTRDARCPKCTCHLCRGSGSGVPPTPSPPAFGWTAYDEEDQKICL